MLHIADGLKTGAVSLAVCIAIGFFTGFFCAPLKGVSLSPTHPRNKVTLSRRSRFTHSTGRRNLADG